MLEIVDVTETVNVAEFVTDGVIVPELLEDPEPV